jgi:ABC-type polysaccharide/polyol phosphate transport system ATPase subunit
MIKDVQNKMDNLVDIKLEGVTVSYRVPTERVRTFKEYSIRVLQGKIEKHSFMALKNINLEINKGEIFGVVGKNGAGKSTLLKVISRVLIPSEGRVIIRGMVYPLLQLGAGFHPELTGKENVFLNGTLLGHSRKEIEQKYDEIVDFSEIADFINSPVRTYSSGMQARLGFAVASAWQPEILVLDEVLSVGDVAFQQKCFKRMQEFRDNGTTTLLVSHSPETISNLCQRAVWLNKGEIVDVDDSSIIAEKYKKWMGIR